MVEIVDELKAKLVEIDGKMEELRREIVVLENQKSAFETVIRVTTPVSNWLRPFEGTPYLVTRDGKRSRHRTSQVREQPLHRARHSSPLRKVCDNC
jgi:hypothetical protein